MVTPSRDAASTVGFIDHYCWIYRSLFDEVRQFECFKYLHLGMLSEIPRKSLPAIARTVGLKNGQGLHHYYQISKKNLPDSSGKESWYIMTNLSGNITLKLNVFNQTFIDLKLNHNFR